MMVTACNANAKQEQSLTPDSKYNKSSQLLIDNFSSQKQSNFNRENNQSSITESLAVKQINKVKPVAYTNPQRLSGSYMTLTPLAETNAQGNPLYRLDLYSNGQTLAGYRTVTGRSYTQNRNRHLAGTDAPLPNGRYTVASSIVPGTHPEVGGRFLPIQPLFQTGRSALGIHYDPSYESSNGEDGTSGCVALTNPGDLDQVLNYIRTYQPQYLEVNI